MSAALAASPPARRGVAPVRHRRTFDRLRHGASQGRSGPVAVGYVREKASSEVQIAYVVGRRVGPAVTRNRLRRRLRALMVESAPTLPAGAYLVRAGAEARDLGFDDLRAALGRALARAVPGGSRASSIPDRTGARTVGAR